MHAHARIQARSALPKAVRVCASSELVSVNMHRCAGGLHCLAGSWHHLGRKIRPADERKPGERRGQGEIVQREHGGLGKRKRSIKHTTTHTFARALARAHKCSFFFSPTIGLRICMYVCTYIYNLLVVCAQVYRDRKLLAANRFIPTNICWRKA